MATKSAKSTKSNGSANRVVEAPASANKTGGAQVKLRPILRRRVKMRVVGTSPHIQHKWGEKALLMMREKHAGKKTKNRDIRNPQKEGEEAAYRTEKGKYGIPATMFKAALINAAHKDIGLERTLVKKALFLVCKDRNNVIEMDCDEPEIREDPVRVGMGSTDLRYRPYFHRWAIDLEWEIDNELLTIQDLCVLVDRAGFGIGIGEWRPERGGEFGRFEIDRTVPIEDYEP